MKKITKRVIKEKYPSKYFGDYTISSLKAFRKLLKEFENKLENEEFDCRYIHFIFENAVPSLLSSLKKDGYITPKRYRIDKGE